MSRLIDADALKREILKYANEPIKLNDRRWDTRCVAICEDMNGMIDLASTIDAEPFRQWISVKDRLPMIDEDVLVFAQGKEDGFILETKIAIAYMTDCTYFGSSPIKVEPRWRCPLQFFLTDYEITHWMPLPEPPKEDDHEAD